MAGTAIFHNLGAGTASTERVARMIELARRALDADLQVASSRDPLEVEAWLSAGFAGCDTAIVVGGDGSLSVACNVASRQPGLTLGYLPAGFGNAAAHMLGYGREPEEIVEVVARRDARPIDLVEVDGRLTLFAGAGWDAEAAGRFARSSFHGLAGWGLAIAGSTPTLLGRHRIEVVADDWVVHRGPYTMLVVSVSPFYGRGLRVNPGARPDAGRLSLRVYPGSVPRFVIEATRWAAGRTPHAARIDAARVRLRDLDGAPIPVQTDGDLIGERPAWEFALRREAVRLIGRWD